MCRIIHVSDCDDSLRHFLDTNDRDLELLMGVSTRNGLVKIEQNPPVKYVDKQDVRRDYSSSRLTRKKVSTKG